MKLYEKKFPNYEFLIIIGSDLVQWLIYWDYGKKLLKEFTYLIYLREGAPLPLLGFNSGKYLMPKKYILADNKEIRTSISSTKARNIISQNMKLKRKKNITKNKELLSICPPSVLKFIKYYNFII